ncbi:hypothetical protein FB451DRAFT_1368231 [Mycena latifolia]|nr:hypothetical protein FB451DRAFT_1368231 [Mycena latifolia]
MSTHLPDNILQYTLVAANALRDVALTTQIPFLSSVASLSVSIVSVIQVQYKFQKERCLRMVEEIHRLLCTIMVFCLHSENTRSPKLLEQIAQYSQTLHKLYSCLRAQTDLGTIKRLLKQSEIIARLDACEADLNTATDAFTMQNGAGVASALLELGIESETRHQELLELLSTRSGSDVASLVGVYDPLCRYRLIILFSSAGALSATGSLSLLPPPSQIFHGRDIELNHLIATLLSKPACGVILGPGGMGKTTLATAALHHPAVLEKYDCRYFISCEAAYTDADLVSVVGVHLGLEPSRQLSKAIVRHLGQGGPCLIVLDNFETPWEPLEYRAPVEEFISLLADVEDLALLASTVAPTITMRGAERPGKVKWNRPFLPPLEPLSLFYTRQIFSDVADDPDPGDESALNALLDLSGGLPLVVSLMASVASFEGYSGALTRWKDENTALLSDGRDKRSALSASLLPDGITEEELRTSKVPVPDLAHCKSSLLRTSLAYLEVNGRLKSLSPIREYMRRVHPPASSISRPLCTHFQDLLALWDYYRDINTGDLVPRITSYLGNINDLMLHVLATDDQAHLDIAYSILKLNLFSVIMLKGPITLVQKVPGLIEQTRDSRLRWMYASACLRGHSSSRVFEDAEILIAEGVQYFSTGECPLNEAIMFYDAATSYYARSMHIPKALEFNTLALSLGQQTDQVELKMSSLLEKCHLAFMRSDAREILQIVREAGKAGVLEDRWLTYEAAAHGILGNLARALELCAQLNDQVIVTGMTGSDRHLDVLDTQAEIHFRKTEYAEAVQIHKIVASYTSPTRSPLFHANALVNIAYIDILTAQDDTEIVRNLHAAVETYFSLGRPRGLVCSLVEAQLTLYRGDTEGALSAFQECFAKSRGGYTDLAVACLAALGDPRNKLCAPLDTFRWATLYFACVRKVKDQVATFHAIRCLADVYAESGDEPTGLNLYHTALEGGTEMDIHRLRGECMLGIGDIMLRSGDFGQSKKMWEAARPLLVRSSQMEDASGIDKRLAKLSHNQ